MAFSLFLVDHFKSKPIAKRDFLSFSAVVLASLLFMVVTRGWHVPSRLILSIQATPGCQVRVMWDSGAGFNAYESRSLRLSPHNPSIGPAILTIRRSGEKAPRSNGTEVWIREIATNGIIYNSTSFPQQVCCVSKNGKIYVSEDGATLSLLTDSSSVDVTFVRHPYSGVAEVAFGRKVQTINLYSPNESITQITFSRAAEYVITFGLPEYDITSLKLDAPGGKFVLHKMCVASQFGKHCIELRPEDKAQPQIFQGIDRGTRVHFSSVNFLLQVFFSVVVAAGSILTRRWIRSHGGFWKVLSAGNRPLFWFMFCGACCAYLFWLVSYRPGTMTADSIDVWQSAHVPGLQLTRHPILNTLLYKFLYQFFDSITVVAVFHILTVAWLGSFVFYRLLQVGAKMWVIAPCYLAFIFSVPIGLYNVMLWKDIPYAVLVVFLVFYVAYQKNSKRAGRSTSISRHSLIIVILGSFLLPGIRYNGVLCLVILLAYCVATKLYPIKRLVKSIGMTLMAVSLVALVASALFLGTNDLGLRSMDMSPPQFVNRNLHMMSERLRKDNSVFNTLKRAYSGFFNVFDINCNYSNRWHVTSDEEFSSIVRRFGLQAHLRYISFRKPQVLNKMLAEKIHRATYEGVLYYLSWNPLFVQFMFLTVVIFRRTFRFSADYSLLILLQVLFLIVTFNLNWRYYYFFYLSAFFLPPMIAVDISQRLHLSRRRGLVDVGDTRITELCSSLSARHKSGG